MTSGSATQSDKLAAAIRGKIVSGKISPGNRLPTFQEIESNFSVSRGVAQLAINRLKKDGFVRSQSNQGLFVVDHPPCLKRYALVFAKMPRDSSWPKFNDAMIAEAHQLERNNVNREFEVFAGIHDQREGPAVIEKLKQEVLSDRFAGLIIKGCQELTDLEPFNNPQLPKVYLLSNGKQPWRPIVTVGAEKMIQQGLDWLAKKGRKRIAVLRVPDYASTWQWEDHFEKAGLDYRAQWIQSVGRHEPSVLQTLIPLLMDYPKNQRPDGLLIIDDNLVGHAVASVNAMGLQIGKDLDIVGHCNWPCQTPSMVPIKRIGFHAGDLLKLGLDLIDTQRRGEKPIEYQCLDPSFEEPYSLG